jgi:hypothetical protein
VGVSLTLVAGGNDMGVSPRGPTKQLNGQWRSAAAILVRWLQEIYQCHSGLCLPAMVSRLSCLIHSDAANTIIPPSLPLQFFFSVWNSETVQCVLVKMICCNFNATCTAKYAVHISHLHEQVFASSV